VQATAFVAHPYQIPTIGWPADIQSWKVEDLQKFFKTNYAPNNCTLVLVGDVDAAEVFGLARRYLEPIPRQAPPPPVRTTEPEQIGEKRVFVQRDAQTPLLYYAYKSVPANDPKVPAIELLMIALTEGNASRLHRLLVEEKQLAIEVGSDYVTGFDPGLAWLRLTLPQGANMPAVEKALDEALEKVVREGISDAELRRAKNLNAADFWKQIETIDGKAFLLGRTEVYAGDYRQMFGLPAMYEKVTLEEVRAAAKLVLQKNHRTVGVLAGKP
jgi:zinc protease